MSQPKARPSHSEIGQHYIIIGPEQGLMPVWMSSCYPVSGQPLLLHRPKLGEQRSQIRGNFRIRKVLFKKNKRNKNF